MSSSRSQRFDELVSKYLDSILSPEEEAELLVLIDKPEHAGAFFEATRLNAEISGVLAEPVSDEEMEVFVARELGKARKTSSRICNAILSSLPNQIAPRHPVAQPLETDRRTKLRLITFPWLISLCLHAAAIVLFILNFSYTRDAAPALNNAPKVSQNNIESESIARIGSVNGGAYTTEASGKNQVSTASDLSEGQGVETIGHGSMADITFDDGTALTLDADTRIQQVSGGQPGRNKGKRVVLDTGTLRVAAAKQPAGRPMEFITDNAKAIVLGTRFTLSNKSGTTRLEVSEGVVRLDRLFDHASVAVKAGEFAIVKAGVELVVRPLPANTGRNFVKGVSLYGIAVTIEGEPWLPYTQALADGLSIDAAPLPNGGNVHKIFVTPVPATDPDTRKMLNSRAYSYQKDMTLTQSIGNGDYEIFLWVIECVSSNNRLFDVQIGSSVWHGVGRQNMSEWKKYGPFRTHVADGKLSVNLKRITGNPTVSGFAIYSVPPDAQ